MNWVRNTGKEVLNCFKVKHAQFFKIKGNVKMDKVKIGLIGLGRWGEVQLSVLSTLSYVDIVAICSRSEERCKDFPLLPQRIK